MESYGIAGSVPLGERSTQTTSAPLEDIARMGDAVEEQTRRIQNFCARFYGEPRGDDEASRDPAAGYHGNLQRLGTEIDRLAVAISRLAEIG